MCCKDCDEIEKFENSFSEEIPYDVIETGADYEVRFFSREINPDLLKWHWDEQNRLVQAISVKTDWKFQFDNEIPFDIQLGEILDIPEGKVHRIIKGTTDLVVKIVKY